MVLVVFQEEGASVELAPTYAMCGCGRNCHLRRSSKDFQSAINCVARARLRSSGSTPDAHQRHLPLLVKYFRVSKQVLGYLLSTFVVLISSLSANGAAHVEGGTSSARAESIHLGKCRYKIHLGRLHMTIRRQSAKIYSISSPFPDRPEESTLQILDPNRRHSIPGWRTR